MQNSIEMNIGKIKIKVNFINKIKQNKQLLM